MASSNTSTTDARTKPTPSCYGGEAEAIQKIADLTIQGTRPEIISVPVSGLGDGLPTAIPVLVKPGTNGGSVVSVKDQIEAYRTGPARRTGTATVTTLASFIELTNRHKDADSTIFAKTDWPNPALTAVIDYHTASGAARNADHRIVYRFPITPEFQAWIDHAGKKFDQAEFAAFLEDHAAELAAPFDAEKIEFERLFKARLAPPNELITLARSLEICVGQRIKNAVKLQSGETDITFVEEHTNTAGEPITVPGVFMIELRAFIDGERVRIPARLRYRATGGGIVWFYDLYRWQDQMRERVSEDLAKAGTDTGLPFYEGAPEPIAR
ncbi:DUF2303 family protein [Methylobacterium sp. Leaf100]|uniref:DUF2303 family protein n=1 Tax=Methylobacterium sp. Leaf100 TaxID=1736252 RepID=UPI0006FF2F9C|nr:DUF2303 family protein [Methylobacterium sp. Leaf100]KQP36676.1 hypothetical protein ASF25_01595 [Methylobacterium sp. Leaf100]